MILAFDTATPATVVAVVGEAVRSEARHDPEPGERPGHVERLLPLAAELLEAAGASFSDVERIAVGTGPGTFTGLRIGVATARGLAQAGGAQLVGVSTLRALAAAARHEGPVLAVLDARRGEAFVAGWHGEEAVVPAAAVAPALLADIAARGSLAVGDGAVRFREVLETSGAEVPADGSPLHRVSALTLADLAAGASSTGRDVFPEYLRLPDAEIALRERRSP